MASKFRQHIQTLHRDIDGVLGHIFRGSPYLTSLVEKTPNQLKPENFQHFTYSKSTHFVNFRLLPAHKNQTLATCDLKVYQDLLIYTFIVENIPPGARILELGGGDSRVITALKDNYEFWNLDKLEGQGHGPKSAAEAEGFRLVRDYIGNFSTELPEHYFDLVYSISAIEHFSTNEKDMQNIIQDMQRLSKRDAYAIHCVDGLIFPDHLKMHPILDRIIENQNAVCAQTDFEVITADNELWTIPPYAYYTRWYPITRKRLPEFGRPFSLNLLWKTSR